MNLIIHPCRYGWVVEGDGINFCVTCPSLEAANLVAHRTRQDFYPSATIILRDGMDRARDERYTRREWRDSMYSDWNE